MSAFVDDDLIEVISVFKCRFCPFKSSDPQEVRDHVTNIHMTVKEELDRPIQSRISCLAGSTETEILQDSNGGDMAGPVNSQVRLMPSHSGGLTQEAMACQAVSAVLSAEEQPANQGYESVLQPDEDIVLEYADIVNDDGKIQVSLPVSSLKQPVASDNNMHNELLLETNNQGSIVEQGMTFTSGDVLSLEIDQSAQTAAVTGEMPGVLQLNPAQVSGIQPTFQSLVTMDNKAFSFDASSAVQAISSSTQTGGPVASVLEDFVSFPEDSWPLQPPQVVTGTRELFLCGQCNMGFVSMDECKTHIEQTHQLSLTVPDSATAAGKLCSVISGPDNPAPNKHSLGVQASGTVGRPRGRKRKEVVVKTDETAGVNDADKAEKQQEELAEEACFLDDYRTDLSSVRRVSSRAVKTPRHLLSEYYIGQKKPSDGRGDFVDFEAGPTKRRKRTKRKTEPEMTSVLTADVGGDALYLEVVCDERDDRSGGGDEEGAIQIAHQESGQLTENDDQKAKVITADKTIPDDKTTHKVTEGGLEVTDHELDSLQEKLPGRLLVASGDPFQEKPAVPVSVRDPAECKQEQESIYPTEEELVGSSSKLEGDRNPYGQRLTHKFHIDEQLKTPKHNYTIKCKYKTCRGRFLSEETHKIHLKCHRRRPGRNTLVCFECEQGFNNWAACKYHLWREHRVDLDLYSCDQCEFRTDMTCKMDLHRVVHREERPYACRECGRGFKQPAQLRNHEVLHEQLQEMEEQLPSQDSKSWFQKQICDICDKEFANSKTLRHHQMVVHGRLRPFLCPHCDHTASTRGALQLHIRIHTGEKPFSCEQCNFSSSDHNTLRRHRMRHTGEKPYRCPHCPYSCIQSVSIKSHIQYKHADQISGLYKCESCDFNSINQKLYLAHLSDHEKGVIPATGLSKAMRRHSKKPLPVAPPHQASSSGTLYACAQCSYTSPDMATLVTHLITHKRRVASTGSTSNNNPPSAPPLLSTNTIQSIILEGGKSRVPSLQPVTNGIPTLQAVSISNPLQANTSQTSIQQQPPATHNAIFLKDDMSMSLLDDTEQQQQNNSQQQNSLSMSEYSGGHVTYASADSGIESQASGSVAVPAEGGGELVYTLRPGQTAIEPLQLLEDGGEQSTFLCMEDGRLQPISLADLQGGQTFLNDNSVLVQDVIGSQVFTQVSSTPPSQQVLGHVSDSAAGASILLDSTSEVGPNPPGAKTEGGQGLGENMEEPTDLPGQVASISSENLVAGHNDKTTLNSRTAPINKEISFKVVSRESGHDIAMVTMAGAESALGEIGENSQVHEFL